MSISLELKALEALRHLHEEARAVKDAFQRAGMSLPPSVATLLGETPANHSHSVRPQLTLPPPASPPRPPEYQDDWIWIRKKELTPTALVPALLRDNEDPVPAKILADEVNALLPEVNPGSVYNLITRLDGVKLRRIDNGWLLMDRCETALIFGDYAWGPARVFSRHELASHRRMLILHLLNAVGGGLQEMQIVRQLEQLPYCYAVVNKSQVKADMQLLKEAGKVKRIGNTKKWTVTRKD